MKKKTSETNKRSIPQRNKNISFLIKKDEIFLFGKYYKKNLLQKGFQLEIPDVIKLPTHGHDLLNAPFKTGQSTVEQKTTVFLSTVLPIC